MREGRFAENVTRNNGKSVFILTYGCEGKTSVTKNIHPRIFQCIHSKLNEIHASNNVAKSRKQTNDVQVCIFSILHGYDGQVSGIQGPSAEVGMGNMLM